jgi:hypothetical protein
MHGGASRIIKYKPFTFTSPSTGFDSSCSLKIGIWVCHHVVSRQSCGDWGGVFCRPRLPRAVLAQSYWNSTPCQMSLQGLLDRKHLSHFQIGPFMCKILGTAKSSRVPCSIQSLGDQLTGTRQRFVRSNTVANSSRKRLQFQYVNYVSTVQD